MAKTDPIDPSVPAGTEDPKLGDNRIRELARAVAEILNIDHYIGSDGGAGTGYNEDAAGEHLRIKFTAPLAADPTNASNKAFLYTKDVSSVVELFWEDEAGNVLQLTSGGVLNPAIACGITGDQTIAGVKTFSSSPIVPTPTTDMQASTKKFVDDAIAALVLAFGARASDDDDANAMVAAHAYLANQDGFVNVTYTAGTQGILSYCRLYVATGDNPPAGDLVDKYEDADYHNANTKGGIGAVPVKSGDYFEVLASNLTVTGIFWTSARGTLVKCTDQD